MKTYEDIRNAEQNKHIKIVHKMNDGCINPDNFQRMSVKTAMVIFSTTMAIAIRTFREYNAVTEKEKKIKRLFESMPCLYVIQTVLRILISNSDTAPIE